MGTRIRWAFHATDHSKIGTVEEVPTDDVPWLIQCGNAVLADAEAAPVAEQALVEQAPAEQPTPTDTISEVDSDEKDAAAPAVPRQRTPRA